MLFERNEEKEEARHSTARKMQFRLIALLENRPAFLYNIEYGIQMTETGCRTGQSQRALNDAVADCSILFQACRQAGPDDAALFACGGILTRRFSASFCDLNNQRRW